jgi:chemotaxis methyl-accepting protein methylase
MCSVLALNGYEVLTGEPENFKYEDHRQHDVHNHDHALFDWRRIVEKVGVKDKIMFKYFDVLNSNFAEKQFDAVFLYDTLQHLKEIEKLYRNVCG